MLLSGGVTSTDEVEGTITIRIDGLNPFTIRADSEAIQSVTTESPTETTKDAASLGEMLNAHGRATNRNPQSS